MTVLGNHFDAGWEESRDEITTAIEDLRTQLDSEEAARDEAVNYMVNNFGE